MPYDNVTSATFVGLFKCWFAVKMQIDICLPNKYLCSNHCRCGTTLADLARRGVIPMHSIWQMQGVTVKYCEKYGSCHLTCRYKQDRDPKETH